MRCIDGDIRKVKLYDINLEYDYYASQNVQLGISKDNNFYIESKYSLEKPISENTLLLEDYVGELYVPRGTGIFVDLDRTLNGMIGSPAYITGDGNINLIIDPETILELILTTEDPVRLNSRLLKKEGYMYNYGRSEKLFQRKYSRVIGVNLPLPTVDENEDGKTARFEKEFSTPIIDICMHYNLVNISKYNGNSNIYYHGPKFHDIKSMTEHDQIINKMRNEKTLVQLMKDAESKEEFEKAVELRDKIKDIRKEFKEYRKRIISEHATGKNLPPQQSL